MVVYKDEQRGTYYFITRVKLLDGTTKQIKRRGFRTKKEAKIAEANALLDTHKETSMTFGEMSAKYIEWYEQRMKNSSTTLVKAILRNYITPEFGNKKLDAIQPRHILDFQNRTVNKYAGETLKKIHATISAIFNFAIKFYNHPTNPAKVAGGYHIEVNKRTNYWELDEFKQFISVIEDQFYRTFFITLYYSGARKGELLGLTWADVDFTTNEIDINKANYKGDITSPKTKGSIRRILLPKFVMELLRQLKIDQGLKFEVKDSYVVFGELNQCVAPSTLDWRINKYIKDAGVKRIVMHEFRHSHASYLINKGVVISMIAKRLGHANVTETLNRYGHLYPSEEMKIVDEMEGDF